MSQSVKGILIILAFLAAGNIISWLISEFIPGNVIGMILLFIALYTGIVKEHSVSKVAEMLTSNMALLFLPTGVGIMAVYTLTTAHLFAIVASTAISTLLVLAVVGIIQDKWGKK